jgi:hypothetical protein
MWGLVKDESYVGRPLMNLCKVSKIFNSLVQIMVQVMGMLDYAQLFSYLHDINSKEEGILLYSQYHSNLSATLYYTQLEVMGWASSYIFQPYFNTTRIC